MLQARQAAERLHHCTAVHVETVPVRYKEGTSTIREADIEVFALEGFTGADCCYVWGFENQRERGKLEFVSVTAVRNVSTPSAAVLAVLEWKKQRVREALPFMARHLGSNWEPISPVTV